MGKFIFLAMTAALAVRYIVTRSPKPKQPALPGKQPVTIDQPPQPHQIAGESTRVSG